MKGSATAYSAEDDVVEAWGASAREDSSRGSLWSSAGSDPSGSTQEEEEGGRGPTRSLGGHNVERGSGIAGAIAWGLRFRAAGLGAIVRCMAV